MRSIITRQTVLSDCKIVWNSVDYANDINDKKPNIKNRNATKIIRTIKRFMWLILSEHI